MRSRRLALALLLPGAVAVAAFVAEAGPAGAAATQAAVAAIDAQLAVVDRTEEVLYEKLALRTREMRTRVRATYKLLRAGDAPLWLDPDARASTARRKAAARLILRRDSQEVALLSEELDLARGAHRRLDDIRDRVDAVAPPPPGTLVAPVDGRIVDGFGRHRHRASGAELSRRGIELRSRAGERVRAPSAGEIRHVGPVRGLGEVVVLEADGLTVVVGRLGRADVALGDRLQRGAPVGIAAGPTIYMETRLPVGGAGVPIDPAPLLDR